MEDVAEIVACALINKTSYIEETKKKYECGNWYDGNKYFFEIVGFEKYMINDSEEIIDGEKIKTEIKLKEKEERKARAQTAKDLKNKNPTAVIKSIQYKKGIFEKERSILELPIDCTLNLPIDFSKNPFLVTSGSMENTVYEVDIETLICPCEEFKKSKKYLFSKNDPRRLCKHLASVIIDKLKIEQNELVYLIINLRSNDSIKAYKFASGISFYICKSNSNNEWINIIARKRKPGEKDGLYTGDYEVYGYNTVEKRWSFGDGPDGASEIKKYF